MRSENTRRVVRGSVGADGTVVGGTGFIITRLAVGGYNLRFTPPFKKIPAITAVTIGSSGFVSIGGTPSAEGQSLYTYQAGGSNVDMAWNFTAEEVS